MHSRTQYLQLEYHKTAYSLTCRCHITSTLQIVLSGEAKGFVMHLQKVKQASTKQFVIYYFCT